jgi:mRNA interferase RelE/StbE
MAWRLELSPEAKRDLARIDKKTAIRILRFLTERAAEAANPRILAIPLQGPRNRGLWRFRIGDYRAVARIENEVMTILVVEIGHRREVYR